MAETETVKTENAGNGNVTQQTTSTQTDVKVDSILGGSNTTEESTQEMKADSILADNTNTEGEKNEDGSGTTDDKKTEEQKTETPAFTEKDLKLKEGFEADDSFLSEATQKLQGLGVSKEVAQKALDLYCDELDDMKKASAEVSRNAWKNTVNKWGSELKKDTEIGGQNLKVNREYALTAIHKLGNPGFNKMVTDGFGNNPSIFKFLVNVGRALGEDSPTQDNTKGTVKKDLGDLLYPNDPKLRK